jgi:hypothetical protein
MIALLLLLAVITASSAYGQVNLRLLLALYRRNRAMQLQEKIVNRLYRLVNP